jgi:putative transposase
VPLHRCRDQLHRAGAPWQNPFVESFGSRVRDELLAVEAFTTLLETRVLMEDWRIE